MKENKVIILDFDGTLYSSEHVFDKLDNFIKRHRREFLPRLTDEQYAKVVKENPGWSTTVAATELAEYMYLFKKKYPEMKILLKDFYDWQNAHPDPLVLDEIVLADPEFLKALCEKYPTYIVSNSPTNHLLVYMKRFKIDPTWFKKLVSNHFVAHDRTKKHYYEAILKKENCLPQNAYVFGDSVKNDLEPAIALGMNICHVVEADKLENAVKQMIKWN